MSSDGEKKLTPAEIAYPSATGGDGYVDHYVGQRRPQTSEPVPVTPTDSPNEEPPIAEEPSGPRRSSKGIPTRWGVLLLAAMATVGFLAKGRFDKETTAEAEPQRLSDVVIKIVSEPPARVYRRQLELGTTPLEVIKDESGTDLELSLDGYRNAKVSFEGASPGAVTEIRVKMELLSTGEPSDRPSPAVEPASPVASKKPDSKATPNEFTQATPTPTATPKPTTAKLPPKPEPVAAQPPAPPPRPPAPVYQPPPRRVAPPPPPPKTGGDSHRIKPPDF